MVVAHPDDEAIWMGGTMLRRPAWNWHIFSLTRSDDPDRAPRFYRAASEFHATAAMSDLDDSPLLAPLSDDLHEIKDRIRCLVTREFDLIFTHSSAGEYTRHLRHEQVSRAVREMVETGEFRGTLVTFSYDDCQRTCKPRPAEDTQVLVNLSDSEYAKKLNIIRDIYNFGEGSFEVGAAGSIEAFRVDTHGWTAGDLQDLLS